METTGLNYLAVGVAALTYMALGAIWYSPLVLGKLWLKLIGKSMEQVTADATPMNYVIGLLTAFVASYGVGRVMAWAGATTISEGFMVGFLLSTCLVFTAMVMNDAFENRPKRLTLINTLYHISGMSIAGVIIAAFG